MKLKYFAAGAVAAAGLALSAAPASAYILGFNESFSAYLTVGGYADTIQALNSGWYASDGFHYAGNYYYGVTPYNDPALGTDTTAHNDFMVFYIGDLTGEILDASISMYQGSLGIVPGASETNSLRLGAYSGAPEDFDTSYGSGDANGISIFNNLGAGDAYGYKVFGPTNDNSYVTFGLNGNFLADLNAAIANQQQFLLIGGTIGYDPAAGPEPATWAMMILGFLGAGAMLRRRRATAAAA